MIEFEGGPVPFQEEDGMKFLTGLQVVQDPRLKEFVERYKDHFRVAYDRDIYIWEPKNDG